MYICFNEPTVAVMANFHFYNNGRRMLVRFWFASSGPAMADLTWPVFQNDAGPLMANQHWTSMSASIGPAKDLCLRLTGDGRSLSMSGAALSTRLMGALRFRGSCS